MRPHSGLDECLRDRMLWHERGLVAKGATVVVIEHDLDLIRNADYVIDMGPGGGDAGGQILCAGTPNDIAVCSKSITGRYL